MKNNKVKNIEGFKSGLLTAKRFIEVKNGFAYWMCDCACGNTCIVRGTSISNGRAKSCGCIKKNPNHGKVFREKLARLRIDRTNIYLLKPRLNKNNTSGRNGVSYSKRFGSWKAKISINTKVIWLGSFATFEEAVAARELAEEKYYRPYLDMIDRDF